MDDKASIDSHDTLGPDALERLARDTIERVTVLEQKMRRLENLEKRVKELEDWKKTHRGEKELEIPLPRGPEDLPIE